VGGLVVVEHQVDDVGLRGDEDDLESGVPEGVGGVCPEEIWRVAVVSCGDPCVCVKVLRRVGLLAQ
jgi:hypothetical protein